MSHAGSKKATPRPRGDEKQKRESPTSLRLSGETKRQIEDLVAKWGTSAGQVVARAVDREYIRTTGADMNQAHIEIDRLNKEFAAARHSMTDSKGLDRYAEQYARDLDAILERHGASKRVAKTFPNGIKAIEAVDATGNVIADWHE
jgi:hypothetical protein